MTNKIGKRISAMRKRKGLTQKELGIKLDVKHNTISDYETGEIAPSVEILIEMTKILECSIDELVGLESEDVIEVDWKHLINDLKKREYSPYTINKILELHEQIQELLKRIK